MLDPKKVDKLTLDTNTVRNLVWCLRKGESGRHHNDEIYRTKLTHLFDRLEMLKKLGVCETTITSEIYNDYHKTPETLPQPILEVIGPYVTFASPHIFGTWPLHFPIAFNNPEELELIFRTAFPHSKVGAGKYLSNRHDAKQLYAHKLTGGDFFISADGPVLSKKENLERIVGIRVMTLEEYVYATDKTMDGARLNIQS